MTTTQYITQDLTTPHRQVVYSKTGDSNRYVEITLFNDGVAWEVPSGASLAVYAEDDGGNYYTSTATFNGNVVTALLPTFTVRGTANTEVEITSGGSTVATFDFYVEVYQSA